MSQLLEALRAIKDVETDITASSQTHYRNCLRHLINIKRLDLLERLALLSPEQLTLITDITPEESMADEMNADTKVIYPYQRIVERSTTHKTAVLEYYIKFGTQEFFIGSRLFHGTDGEVDTELLKRFQNTEYAKSRDGEGIIAMSYPWLSFDEHMALVESEYSHTLCEAGIVVEPLETDDANKQGLHTLKVDCGGIDTDLFIIKITDAETDYIILSELNDSCYAYNLESIVSVA